MNNFEKKPIITHIRDNLDFIKTFCDSTSDLLVNEITVSGVKIALLGCEGMISTSISTQLILHPLMNLDIGKTDGNTLLEHINAKMLLSLDRPIIRNYGDLFRTLSSGFAIIIANGADHALALGVQGYDKRSISEPSSEGNIMGAREGFVEVVRTNMSLIRRRMKTPFLKLELFVKGEKSKTDLCLCYMRDRVPSSLLKQIKESLEKMDLETILSTGYVRPFLEQKPNSLFDSVGMTERPDVLCSKLLEGRVALLIDGTPYALIIPKLINESFQTLDDYDFKPYYGTLIRWIKYLAFFISMLLPSFYVSAALHHPELLNSTLLLILAEAEKNAPFSIVTQSIGVLLMYEVIKEAGIRLPKGVGGAVSIISGLIIGDSAVKSGLISTPLLTVAALSIISGFVIPDLNQQITVLRIIFILAGGLWGIYGISLAGAALMFCICATEDYGFPFTAPISPFLPKAMRDIAVRSDFRKMQNDNFTVEKVHEN